MKKTLFTIALACTASVMSAQEYLHLKSHWYEEYIPVEVIDSVTYGEASHADKLPAIMAQDPNISIFNEALQVTHLCDSLLGEYDFSFQWEDDRTFCMYGRDLVPTVTKVAKGYTAFAETNSVYAAHGINNLEDLKAYAAKVYDEMYPEDASVTDLTDRRNSLNRFVAYHLLDRKGTTQTLTAAGIENDRAGRVADKYVRTKVDIADWYETMMPHSLLKCSSPLLSTGGETVYINRRGVGEQADSRGVFIAGTEIVNVDAAYYQGKASNGYYHYIDDIIAYDKQTQEVVLDEQIIVNNSTMSPEFMNNNMRINNPYGIVTSNGEVCLPAGSMKNIQIHNPETRFYYLFSWGWSNAQTDEFLIVGPVDIAIKLPPVPAGTYELNMGYTATSVRSAATFYLNGEFCDTVDLSISSSDPRIGWIADENCETDEEIAQNDSLLHAHGYRKGLDYCYSYTNTETQRDKSQCLRRIITTFTTDGKTDYYLRIKRGVSYSDNYREQFMMDYLELCPTHILKEYK